MNAMSSRMATLTEMRSKFTPYRLLTRLGHNEEKVQSASGVQQTNRTRSLRRQACPTGCVIEYFCHETDAVIGG